MTEPQKLKIRPYARLLTMLGEQLIKNERVAIIEIIKNSYDADATWVKVDFQNFGPNYESNNKSAIIITDNGSGMSEKIIKEHWVNPATPEKKKRKKIDPITPLGRHLQGEKGIGRFAILKLGKTVSIKTKEAKSTQHQSVNYDFSDYGDDFDDTEDQSLFLDDLSISLSVEKGNFIGDSKISVGYNCKTTPTKGTEIKISNLKRGWTEFKVRSAYKDISKLQSIFPSLSGKKTKGNFEVFFHKDGRPVNTSNEYVKELRTLISDKPVLKLPMGFTPRIKRNFRINSMGKKKL